MKLIGYIRVSTDDQSDNGHSIALVQPQIIAEWCERNGHELVDVVMDDGVSAGTPLDRRNGGKALLAMLSTSDLDGVVVWKLDRLFRLGVDALTMGTWFLNRGLHIQSATEHVDINKPEGWMTFGIMALTAEYERHKIIDRATDVSRTLRARGRVYGPVPYGCVALGDLMYRDPAQWAIRQEIVDWRACGYSYQAIIDKLWERRIPAPNGGRHWGKSTIRGILEVHHDLEHIPLLEQGNEAEVSAA